MHHLLGFFGFGCGDDVVTAGGEQFAKEKQGVQFVVDHQDFGRLLLQASILLPCSLRYGCHRKMRGQTPVEGCIEQLSNLLVMFWIVVEHHRCPMSCWLYCTRVYAHARRLLNWGSRLSYGLSGKIETAESRPRLFQVTGLVHRA